MNRTNRTLQKLAAAARKAHSPPQPEAEEAPLGFATRVAAITVRQRPPWPDALERCGWWAAAVSVAICLTAVALSENMDSKAFDPFLGAEISVETF